MQSPFFSLVLYLTGYEDLDFNKNAYFHGISFDLTEIFEGNIFNPIEKKKLARYYVIMYSGGSLIYIFYFKFCSNSSKLLLV